ncbi:MAG: polysaccharide biosynthesis tyrosine autokinase [Anaerolineae bacterium]|nr:polysaccharide biosynthesis tyrosine autokinase [Anaerolineae bacterium]
MELERLFVVLRKWWWFMLLAMIVAGVSSFLAVRRQPINYQARAVLMVGNALNNPTPTGNDFSLPQQLAALYAPIAESAAVRERTQEVLGLSFLPGYSARAMTNGPFIEIIVTDTNPERAKAVANELANQLILQSPTAPNPDDVKQAEFVASQLADLQASIEETQAEILAKENELQSVTSARDIATLEGEIEALRSKLRSTRAIYADYLVGVGGGSVNSITLFSAANAAIRVGSGSMTTVLVVAAIGFMLAFGAAYMLEYLDDTIKKPDDIKWTSNLQALPGIGRFETDGSDHSKLITLTQPRSPNAESYRALRTNIKAAVEDHLSGTLLVTSARPGEGKSVTSANLAIAMAQQGHNVLLIDGDLRRPMQHHLFDLRREPGLADLLHELNVNDHIKDIEGLLKGVLQRTPERRLVVLTCGSIKQVAFELLSSEIMHKILDALSNRFDFVILDSPPVLAVSDAVGLSTQVDYVIIVGEAHKLRRKELREVESRLREANANVIGITLNRVKRQNTGFYYTYYREYVEEDNEKPKDGRNKKAKSAVSEKPKDARQSDPLTIEPQPENLS